MNVFLSTPLFAKVIDGDPLVVDIHFRRAWSLFPTRIYAEGLSIRSTDSHVEWVLHVDDVDFGCSFVGLARKQFHVTYANGNGISFRVRMKVPPPGATPEEQHWLPPIDGLGAVGIIPPTKYAGTWNDKDWDLWTIHLDNVLAEHVHEVWIDGVRFDGDARITGGFYLKPIRQVEVGPAHVEVRSGRTLLRGAALAEPIEALLDFKLDRFDPRTVTDADLLHHISLSVDASTVVPSVHDLPLSVPDGDAIEGRVDMTKLALRIVKGVVRDGTHLDVRAPELRGTFVKHAVSTGMVVTADVANGTLTAQGSLDDARADIGILVKRISFSATSAALDLASPLGDLHGVADVMGAQTDDAARLWKLLPPSFPVHVNRGQLLASAHVEGWRKGEWARGNVTLRTTDLDARVEDRSRASGTVDVTASVDAFRFETKHAENLHAVLQVADGVVALPDASGSPLFRASKISVDARVGELDSGSPGRGMTARRAEAHLDVSRLSAAEGAARPAFSVAHVSAFASSPRLATSDPLANLQLVANVEGGRLGVASVFGGLFPARGIALTSSGDGDFHADAAGQITGHVARGAASFHARGLGVAGDKLHATGDIAAVANVGQWDLRGGTLSGDVRIVVENVTGGFDPHARAPELFAAHVDARASANDLDLAHPDLGHLDFGLKVQGARIPDARALNAFLPSPHILAIESGSAELSADIDTSRTDRAGPADLRVLLPNVGARLHETHLGGDITVDVKARATGPEHRELALDGSGVTLRNVHVADSSKAAAAWSADVVLQEGILRLDPVPRLGGSLTVRARDPSPILGVLLQGTLPNVLAKLTQMPTLTVATDFVITPDTMLATNLIASGSDLSLLGTYALHGDTRRAAFVAQKGPWSAGLRLDDEGTHLHLFGLNQWYAEQREEALRLAGCVGPEMTACAGAER